MYENYYGLSEKPFSLLPDPDYLYLSRHHQKALSLLEYGILNQAGFCVISGQAGAGKTTLIRHLLNHFDKDTTIGLLSNTHESFEELLAWILMSFDLPYQNKNKTELYQCFVDFLIEQYAKKRHTVLIIDEAQNMSPAALEELRMLSNVNADKDQLLQMILMGQPGLLKNLQCPELRQFAQRIAVDYRLDAMNEDETCAYIRHRLKVAGAKVDIFNDSACEAVYKHTRGLPRLINLLCDTALVYGYAENAQKINSDIINDVVKERDENTILPHYSELNEQVTATETQVKIQSECDTMLENSAEFDEIIERKITSCGETSSHNEHLSTTKSVASSENKTTSKATNVSPIQTASVTSLKQAEYFSKAMNLKNKPEAVEVVEKTQNETDESEIRLADVLPVKSLLSDEPDDASVVDTLKSENVTDKTVQASASRSAGKLGFIILGFAFGLLLSVATVILYKIDNLAAPVANKDEIAGRMNDIENDFARKLQAIQQQREIDLEKNRAITQEKEASQAQAAALQRERDAALAIAKAREELLQAKLKAEQAMQKERLANEQARLARERAHAAELEASLNKQREQEAALVASRLEKALSAQPKQLDVKQVLPEPFVEDEASESVTVKNNTTDTDEQVAMPPKNDKAVGFSSNPCDGRMAKLISTCKK